MTAKPLDISIRTFTDYFYVPLNQTEYERLVTFMDSLIDIVGENEQHPLVSLMEIVGVSIEKYEENNVPELF